MDLTKLASSNLKELLSLETDDTITANRGTITKQDDYVQIDNVQDIEHAIYFTFHELVLCYENKQTDKKKLFLQMDEAIDKIYGNSQLNGLMDTDKQFYAMIISIDDLICYLDQKYLFHSPFYKYFPYVSPFVNCITDCLKKYSKFSEALQKTMDEINGIETSDEEDIDLSLVPEDNDIKSDISDESSDDRKSGSVGSNEEETDKSKIE